MTKKEKALLIVVAIITVLLIFTYVIIHNAKQEQTAYVEYPKGTLSDSLFVSQNNTYTENKSLPETYEFERIPFSIDLPSGASARVGDGYIVKIDEQYMIYISEHDANTSAQTLFLNEFPAAIMMNYSPLYTYAQTMTSQTGYINGSSADYEFDIVNISDGAISKPAYAAIYDVKQLEKPEYASKIIVAAITTNTDNESLQVTKALIDSIMLTFRYSEKLDSKMKNNESEYITSEEEDIEDAEIIGEVSSKPTSTSDLINDSDVDASLKGIRIDEEYDDLYIVIYAEHPSELATMALFDEEFNEYTELSESEDYLTFTFHVGEVKGEKLGRYILKVTYSSSVGTISMKLEERGEIESL